MKRCIANVGVVAGAVLTLAMLAIYCATKHGLFEQEPVGVVELRQQREASSPTWLPRQVAWLKLDGTHIDYPVMQASDNQWYLSHDYYGNQASSGAIFLDYRNAPDFSDSLSIIYGHRMNGDLMFSDLAKYRDDDYFADHATGVLATPEKSTALRVLAYREIFADDALYYDLSLSDYSEPTLVLSTCSRTNHDQRVVLVIAFDNREELW